MNKVADVLMALAVVGGILVLTRPGSQGPSLVSALGGAAASIFGVATGQAVTTKQISTYPQGRLRQKGR